MKAECGSWVGGGEEAQAHPSQVDLLRVGGCCYKLSIDCLKIFGSVRKGDDLRRTHECEVWGTGDRSYSSQGDTDGIPATKAYTSLNRAGRILAMYVYERPEPWFTGLMR